MQLKVASSQGIESFYEIICENNQFEESKKAIESFLSWSQFYEQVVMKVQISLNNNNLFKCSFLINVFDDQIEELKKLRNSAEKKIQKVIDQNAFIITQRLDVIVEKGGVVHDNEICFLKFLEKHDTHWCELAGKLEPISIDLVKETYDEIKVKMNHESVVQLLEQMQSILLDTMNHFHLTPNYDSSYSVLSRMRTSDQEPNDMEEFKQFQKGFSNELRSFIDYNYSPKREILKIANLVMATLKNDKEKVEKIHKFSDDDVLYHRTEI